VSFRTRLALVSAAAVGLAVVVASVVVFVVVHNQLLGQVDRALSDRASALLNGPGLHVDEGGILEVPGPGFGVEHDYVQAVPVKGRPLLTADVSTPLPVTNRDRQAARGGHGYYFNDRQVRGVEFRVLTISSSPFAIQIYRPLTEVNRTLHRITLFLILIAAGGVAVAAALVLVVRPLAVLPLLWPERMRWGEKAFISLTGFKGAVPILLAALAVLQGVADAGLIYRLVFVVVAASVLAQGLALEPLSHRLGVQMTARRRPRGWALSIALRHEPEGVLRLIVAPDAIAAGRRIGALPIGEHTWVALVVRGGRTEQPRGSLRLEPGDEVVLLSDPVDEQALRHVFTRPREARAPKRE